MLLDLALGKEDGLSVLARISEHAPSVPVVIVSATETTSVIRRALACGAAGFLPKSADSTTLIAALRLVLDGGIYVPPAVLNSEAVDDTSVASRANPARHNHNLTLRQLEVLSLLSKGLSNKGIARRLNLSESTVKLHIAAILRALGVNNRTQAALVAERLDLEG